MSSSGFASRTMKVARSCRLRPCRASVSLEIRPNCVVAATNDLRRRHPDAHHVGHLDVRGPGRVAVRAEARCARPPHSASTRLRAWIPNVACALGRFVAAACVPAAPPPGMLSLSQLEVCRHAAIPEGSARPRCLRCCLISPMNSSSTSLSRARTCANASRLARSAPVASSSAKMCAVAHAACSVRFVDRRRHTIRRRLLEAGPSGRRSRS